MFQVNIISAIILKQNTKLAYKTYEKFHYQLVVATPRYGLAQDSVPARNLKMFPGQANIINLLDLSQVNLNQFVISYKLMWDRKGSPHLFL